MCVLCVRGRGCILFLFASIETTHKCRFKLLAEKIATRAASVVVAMMLRFTETLLLL